MLQRVNHLRMLKKGSLFPVDEIRTDIERIKQMGIDHIIFGYIGKDLDKVIDITKQLSKFAR